MASAESSILTSFLLAPASLPSVLTLAEFKNLFPRSYHSHPHILVLYRELQHRRALVTDRIRQDIAAEVKRGEGVRRQLAKTRRRAEHASGDGGDGREIEMEVELLGSTSNLPNSRTHTLASIIPEMEAACADIEAEIAAMEVESRGILAEMESTVGELSDLRYGRFSRPSGGADTVVQDVLEGLQRLREASDGVGAP